MGLELGPAESWLDSDTKLMERYETCGVDGLPWPQRLQLPDDMPLGEPSRSPLNCPAKWLVPAWVVVPVVGGWPTFGFVAWSGRREEAGFSTGLSIYLFLIEVIGKSKKTSKKSSKRRHEDKQEKEEAEHKRFF